MLIQRLQDVGTAKDLRALSRHVEAAALAWGLPLFSYFAVTAAPGVRPVIKGASNTPSGFLEQSFNQANVARDPVLQALKRSATPVCYDADFYQRQGAGDLYELQSPFGYRHGISVAIHQPDSTHFVLGMDGPDPLPSADSPRRARWMADLHLLACHAHCAVRRMNLPEAAAQGPRAALSERERAVLQWVLEGKSNWSIGEILKISEHTVDFHLRRAMRKFAAFDRYQAAYAAWNAGLL